MKDDITLKGVRASESDLLKLKELLEKVGAEVEIDNLSDYQVASKVKIQFDTHVVTRKTERNAGRKKIKPEISYTIGDVKSKVEVEGVDQVATELNISRSTYFRRMREYRQVGASDNSTFQ